MFLRLRTDGGPRRDGGLRRHGGLRKDGGLRRAGGFSKQMVDFVPAVDFEGVWQFRGALERWRRKQLVWKPKHCLRSFCSFTFSLFFQFHGRAVN